MDNFKKQFNKGILELGILKLLHEKDQYGYSIIQEINKRTNNAIELKDGTLYPILYRLEDQDVIESYWHTETEGRSKPRKYYRITDKGTHRFEVMLKDYLEITRGFENIIKK